MSGSEGLGFCNEPSPPDYLAFFRVTVFDGGVLRPRIT